MDTFSLNFIMMFSYWRLIFETLSETQISSFFHFFTRERLCYDGFTAIVLSLERMFSLTMQIKLESNIQIKTNHEFHDCCMESLI